MENATVCIATTTFFLVFYLLRPLNVAVEKKSSKLSN